MKLKFTPLTNVLQIKEWVYGTIKNNILDFTLQPGEKITEKDVSEVLDVSRTPVREAFTILEGEKLLEVKPREGTYVTKVDMPWASNSIFFRRVSELEVCKELLGHQFLNNELVNILKENLNAQQQLIMTKNFKYSEFHILDNAFHELLFKGANRMQVWTMLQSFTTSYERINNLELLNKKAIREVHDNHCKLLTALQVGDLQLVEQLISQHYDIQLQALDGLLNKYSKWFIR